MLRKSRILFWCLLVLLYSCNSDDNEVSGEPKETDVIVSDELSLNPSSYSPLSASIAIKTTTNVSVKLTVEGNNGSDSDLVHEFPDMGSDFSIPVHGLYADSSNRVILEFTDSSGESRGTKTYTIATGPLLSDLPQIDILKVEREAMAEGVTLVSYFGHDGSFLPQRPFMFDSYGDIRWYWDFREHPELNQLFYDNGVERLSNGNLYFGSGGAAFGAGANNKVYEMDLFGNIVDSWEMPGYVFHHQVHEKPNGNFVVTVNKIGAPTIEDYIIEIDRLTKEIINVWDLNQSLDNSRTTWTTDAQDWFHANAVLYDPSDDSIIVSGRTQGLVKLTANNEVVWIIAPHKEWQNSGSGVDLNQFLLTPLDKDGQAISDQAVLDGDQNHPDFEWSWYQHAPLITPEGHIMLFDNGDNRNFTGSEVYSRAVTYDLDELNMTIQQVWQYGKERGTATYSRIVSDVDYLQPEDHILFSPGAVNSDGRSVGKSIEIDYASGNVIFEAEIIPPSSFFGIITLHRTERLPLYPD